jgi:glutaredoxin 3
MSSTQSQSVVVYTIRYCPFCEAAVQLLEQLGVQYEEKDISGERDRRGFTAAILPGHYTAPLILVGDRPIGGYTEMMELHRRGQFLPLLSDS